MSTTIKIGNREVALLKFRAYCQAYSEYHREKCNVDKYIKYIVLKLVQAGIAEISPLEVYILLEGIQRGRKNTARILAKILADTVKELFFKKRYCNGAITLRRVEKILAELQNEVRSEGLEKVMKKYLPEYWS